MAFVVLALLVAACSSSQVGSSPASSASTRAPASQPSAGINVVIPSRTVPGYRVGAATASLTYNGKTFQFANGTCAQPPVVGYQFTFVSGSALVSPGLDISIVDLSDPLHDGDYSGPLDIISFAVDGGTYVVSNVRTTFRAGVTAGEFSGNSVKPTGPVTGTFTCG